MPILSQVLDAFGENTTPRESLQPAGSVATQPPVETTHVSGTVVEASTRTVWGGVPTRIAKDDQGPSFPSLATYNQQDRTDEAETRNEYQS